MSTGPYCQPSRQAMEKVIIKHSYGSMRLRRVVAKQLSMAIARESKRWSLSRLAMLAVASVESDFRSRLRGPVTSKYRLRSIGVWQLHIGDSPVRQARLTLLRLCRPSFSQPGCPAMAWKQRRRSGRFRASELGNIILGTWIFAHELTQHVKSCKRRHRRGHPMPLGMPRWLGRWGHYNTGPKNPTKWYRYKLARQYRLFRRLLCQK